MSELKTGPRYRGSGEYGCAKSGAMSVSGMSQSLPKDYPSSSNVAFETRADSLKPRMTRGSLSKKSSMAKS